MKIAAHVLAYNVNRFLSAVLLNLEPHVDKIYIAYPEKPFGYNEFARLNSINPTTISDVISASVSDKIEIIRGDWLTEEDMRNDCLNRAKAEGFDWFIIQDADEFYPDSTWDQMKNIMKNSKSDDHLVTTWYNFWKTSQYVLMHPNGSIKDMNAGFAIRCSSDAKFVHKRICNGKTRRNIDCPCYHYGYVMSDAEMTEKISTWGHTNEIFSKSWIKYKWLNWNENTVHLNPINPKSWLRAIRFPLEQPNFSEQFALPISPPRIISISDTLGDSFYNSKVNIFETKKLLKYAIKATTGYRKSY